MIEGRPRESLVQFENPTEVRDIDFVVNPYFCMFIVSRWNGRPI